MKIDDLLKTYQIKMFVFPEKMWDRPGFYFPDLRTMYVWEKLTGVELEKVILHELGHINHNPKLYARMLLQYENEADRFMIRELIKDYLSNNDVYSFDWLRFANHYKISTSWGQQMIQDEFKKLI